MNRDYGTCLRMKAPHQYNLEAVTEGSQGHNTLIYIKPSVYNVEGKENYHPEWFSYPDNSQLCYLAHGDEESAELLATTFAERMKGFIKEQIATRPVFALSQMDNPSCCNCEACVEYRDKYGCNSAQGIQFINKVYDNYCEVQNSLGNTCSNGCYYGYVEERSLSTFRSYINGISQKSVMVITNE